VLTFSYTLIGELRRAGRPLRVGPCHPRAAVAREFTDDVATWLESEGVPAIDHIETRELVTSIRDEGAMKCGIAAGEDVTPEDAKAELAECKAMSDHVDIGQQVTIPEKETHLGDGSYDVALIDCGAKGSIISSLTERGADVHVLPCTVSAEEIRDVDPDILFVSNGPGDPANFENTQSLVEELRASCRSPASVWASRSSPAPLAATPKRCRSATAVSTSRFVISIRAAS